MLLNKSKESLLNKDKIEQIQKKKIEYKLLGSFSRTKGLSVFSYNLLANKLEKLNIVYSNEVHIFHDGDNLNWHDPSVSRLNIDSKNIYFEALNERSAKKRVRKFKEGKIKDLFNFKNKSNTSINFF